MRSLMFPALILGLLVPVGPAAIPDPGPPGTESGSPAAIVPAPLRPSAPPPRVAAVLPLPGARVAAGFDAPAAPWARGHRGVDLVAPTGSTVRAALGGRIVFAGSLAGTGVVSIDHGGFRTTYQPIDPMVRRGQRVREGQPIGLLVRVGGHCLPDSCLHWGLRTGSGAALGYRDPLALLRPVVRLLPLTPGDGPAGTPDEAARW